MADQRDLQVPGESCSEVSSFSIPGTYSRGEADLISDLLQSSPPVLETSHTTDKRQKHRPRRTQSTPILLGDEQPLVDQIGDCAKCCTSLVDFCRNSMIKLRNSAFIYPIQLVFSSIPISAIVMGVFFAGSCHKVHFLPVFGTIVGAIAMAIWVYVTCSCRRGTPWSNLQTILFRLLCFVILVMTTIEAVLVYTMSPSFDPTSAEYCDETFYTYAFYKEIATAVAAALWAIIYVPGSLHIWCYDCTMLSSPNVSYVNL